MEDLHKAAVLLLSMDKPLAAEVMSQLPKDQVAVVTMQLAKMDEITQEQQDVVLDEFNELTGTHTVIERGGKDSTVAIRETVRGSMSSVPFDFLQKAGVDNLLTFIVEEHPQTIALIMSHLSPNLAAEVLSGLPSKKQFEVIRRIANMEQTSPEVIRDVESSLKKRMTSTFSQQTEAVGGVPMAIKILKVADCMTNKSILENLEQDDFELVDELQRLMFVFDDLCKLDDKFIQTLLKEVDPSQWALALKGASEEIKQKILGNLPQRAAELLREELEYLGPAKVSDVEGMQQKIVDIVHRLEESGEVEVASSLNGEMLFS